MNSTKTFSSFFQELKRILNKIIWTINNQNERIDALDAQVHKLEQKIK